MLVFVGLLFVSGAVGHLSTPAYGCLTFGIGLMLLGIAEWASGMLNQAIASGDDDAQG